MLKLKQNVFPRFAILTVLAFAGCLFVFSFVGSRPDAAMDGPADEEPQTEADSRLVNSGAAIASTTVTAVTPNAVNLGEQPAASSGTQPWDAAEYWERPLPLASGGNHSKNDALPSLVFGLRTGGAVSREGYDEVCRKHLRGYVSTFIASLPLGSTQQFTALSELSSEYSAEMESILHDYGEATLEHRFLSVEMNAFATLDPEAGEWQDTGPQGKFATSYGGYVAQSDWSFGLCASFDDVHRRLEATQARYKVKATALLR